MFMSRAWAAKSILLVDHGTNDCAKVHGNGTRADGRRSESGAKYSQMVGSRDRRPAPSILGSRSNVVHNQAGYLALPITKAPETRIYFINDRSGAFRVLRLRTVVRGERAGRSIVNRTTALRSIWMVSSLILAGPGIKPVSHERGVAKSSFREALTEPLIGLTVAEANRTDSTTNKRKETNINSGVV